MALASAEYNATTSAVNDLADQLAVEAGAPQDDVDESADLTGLREQDSDVVIDKTDKADPLYARTISSFEDERLELPPPLLKGLNEMHFVRPSKIQAASLPKIWAGRNLLAQSHNGTGKTACFVLGMLKVVSSDKTPQALCICPTRELAQQIATEVLKMGKYMVQEAGVRVKCILREERYEKGAQMEEQVIIGTPGKVWTLINMRVMPTAKMRIFVLDEADEMLALGSLGDQSKRIRQKLPKNVQTLFFSATWTDPVIKFAKQLSAVSGHDWSQIEVQRDHIFNDQVKQMYYRCQGMKDKESRLTEILNVVTVGQCIIFVHTREAVDKLAELLTSNGLQHTDSHASHTVSSLHGRMESTARDKVLEDFRASSTRFLITTNVLSRGIDVPAVTLVIQFDMPVEQCVEDQGQATKPLISHSEAEEAPPPGRAKAADRAHAAPQVKKGGHYDPETYLHRVGRTGRFGRPGAALNMIHDDTELRILKQIETYYSREGLIVEVPADTGPEDFETLLKAT